jgi:serine acetyltransferase
VHGDIGTVGVVKVQQLPEVDTGKHVAVEHHHGVVAQTRRDVGDAAAGAQWVLLGDVFDLHPELGAVA